MYSKSERAPDSESEGEPPENSAAVTPERNPRRYTSRWSGAEGPVGHLTVLNQGDAVREIRPGEVREFRREYLANQEFPGEVCEFRQGFLANRERAERIREFRQEYLANPARE